MWFFRLGNYPFVRRTCPIPFFLSFHLRLLFMGDLPGQGTLLLWDRGGYPCGIVLGEPGDHYPSGTVILKMSDLKEQYSYRTVFFRSRVLIRLLLKNTHPEDYSS